MNELSAQARPAGRRPAVPSAHGRYEKNPAALLPSPANRRIPRLVGVLVRLVGVVDLESALLPAERDFRAEAFPVWPEFRLRRPRD